MFFSVCLRFFFLRPLESAFCHGRWQHVKIYLHDCLHQTTTTTSQRPKRTQKNNVSRLCVAPIRTPAKSLIVRFCRRSVFFSHSNGLYLARCVVSWLLSRAKCNQFRCRTIESKWEATNHDRRHRNSAHTKNGRRECEAILSTDELPAKTWSIWMRLVSAIVDYLSHNGTEFNWYFAVAPDRSRFPYYGLITF